MAIPPVGVGLSCLFKITISLDNANATWKCSYEDKVILYKEDKGLLHAVFLSLTLAVVQLVFLLVCS